MNFCMDVQYSVVYFLTTAMRMTPHSQLTPGRGVPRSRAAPYGSNRCIRHQNAGSPLISAGHFACENERWSRLIVNGPAREPLLQREKRQRKKSQATDVARADGVRTRALSPLPVSREEERIGGPFGRCRVGWPRRRRVRFFGRFYCVAFMVYSSFALKK